MFKRQKFTPGMFAPAPQGLVRAIREAPPLDPHTFAKLKRAAKFAARRARG